MFHNTSQHPSTIMFIPSSHYHHTIHSFNLSFTGNCNEKQFMFDQRRKLRLVEKRKLALQYIHSTVWFCCSIVTSLSCCIEVVCPDFIQLKITTKNLMTELNLV